MAENIKSNKEFFGWLAGIVVATVLTIGWLSTTFVTTAKAEETSKEIRQEIKVLAIEVKASNRALTTHMDKQDLNIVVNKISYNKTQTFNIKQFTRVNGLDSQSEARLLELEGELEGLVIKRGCIIAKNPLCN